MKTIEYVGNVVEVENKGAISTLLKNISDNLFEGDSIRVTLYSNQNGVKELELQWVLERSKITPVTFCPCGCTRPAGYWNYGPEDGWAHCPECGMV